MKRNLPNPRKEEITRPPAHPITGPRLIQRLRAALTKEFGSAPTFRQLGNVFGQPRTTIQHWFQFDHPHIQFFLGLLEHLPEPRRFELLTEFCRELPLLSHSRLAPDPIAVTKLEALLKRKSGFTLISGGTDYQRPPRRLRMLREGRLQPVFVRRQQPGQPGLRRHGPGVANGRLKAPI